MSKYTALVKRLSDYDIPIISSNEEDEIVYSENFVVKVEEDGALSVAFHVSSIPEDVAIVCFILKEVRVVAASSKVRVGDSYYSNPDGTCSFGNDAFKKYEDLKRRLIINRYEKEKNQEKFLMDDKNCFHC